MLGVDDSGGVGGEGEGGGRGQEGHSGREVCPNGRASRGHDACPGTCPRLARRRWRLWRVAARALDAAREVAAQSRTRALLAQITSTPSPGILAGASSRVALSRPRSPRSHGLELCTVLGHALGDLLPRPPPPVPQRPHRPQPTLLLRTPPPRLARLPMARLR